MTVKGMGLYRVFMNKSRDLYVLCEWGVMAP